MADDDRIEVYLTRRDSGDGFALTLEQDRLSTDNSFLVTPEFYFTFMAYRTMLDRMVEEAELMEFHASVEATIPRPPEEDTHASAQPL